MMHVYGKYKLYYYLLMKQRFFYGILCLFGISGMLATGCTGGINRSLEVSDLKCENIVNPLGIDNSKPHFSWKLRGSGWGRGQSAFEIEVASDSVKLLKGEADLWTVKTEGAKSVMVPYGGKELHSRQLAYWRVRAWNENGEVSGWSRMARFAVGVLAPDSLHGRYIGGSSQNGSMESPLLRKKIDLRKDETDNNG